MNNLTSLEINKIHRTYFANKVEMQGFIKGLNQLLRGDAQKLEIVKVEPVKVDDLVTGITTREIRLTYRIPSDNPLPTQRRQI